MKVQSIWLLIDCADAAARRGSALACACCAQHYAKWGLWAKGIDLLPSIALKESGMPGSNAAPGGFGGKDFTAPGSTALRAAVLTPINMRSATQQQDVVALNR